MTQDNWQYCPTMKSVVEAQERGDEIECRGTSSEWCKWDDFIWRNDWKFRCRPAKPKTKTVVLREALIKSQLGGEFVIWCTEKYARSWPGFVCWLGNERTVEVPC